MENLIGKVSVFHTEGFSSTPGHTNTQGLKLNEGKAVSLQ